MSPPIVPLQYSINRWVPYHRESVDVMTEGIDTILGTVSRENALQIAIQLRGYAGDSQDMRQGLSVILDRILYKALHDEPKAGVYAFICRALKNYIFSIATTYKEKSVGYQFMHAIMTRTQTYFDQRHQEGMDTGEADDSESGKTDPGLVRFTGELLRQKLIKSDVVIKRIGDLLESYPPNDRDLESVCTLLRHVGRILDTPDTVIDLDECFGRMAELASSDFIGPPLSPHVGYMLLVSCDM